MSTISKDSDVVQTILNYGIDQTELAVLSHFHQHFSCIIHGFAILVDGDGMWCSRCEKKQFDIGVEEQSKEEEG